MDCLDDKGMREWRGLAIAHVLLYNPGMQNENDTIAAIATPPGVGGIGVIRVSGPDAFSLVMPLFRQPHGRYEQPQSHMLTYGLIIDPTTEEVVDEVLVACMNAPRTYTSENVVEIQGHGGPLVLQRMLRLVLRQGARMANPGEFTLRAFLNGRLDLAQAERSKVFRYVELYMPLPGMTPDGRARERELSMTQDRCAAKGPGRHRLAYMDA